MERFKVAAVQMNALRDDVDHNLEVHGRLAREAADDGCRLVMFPELSVTAHFGDAAATSHAEAADDGRIAETMHELARELGIVIAYGFCEAARGTFYNTHALVGPDGLIGVQRKVHASKDEYFTFRMGRSLSVFHLGFCRVATLICYDANFSEAWRVLALKGADVLLLPHASRTGWGEQVSEQNQRRHLEARLEGLPGRYGVYAADNAVFAVFGNQFGYNGHSTHAGGAYIIGPDGKTLLKSHAELDDIWISAELDPELQTKCRNSTHCTLKMRRPELYGEVTRMA